MALIFCIVLILMYGCGEQKGPASQSPPQPESPIQYYNKQVVTIVEKPVKVTMKLLDQDRDYYHFELNVIYGKEKIRFENEMIQTADLNHAILRQRRRTGWKGNYFFIGQGCDTGGNAARLCLDLVFTVRQGKLVYIGEALGGEEPEAGGSYKGGVFRDVYDKFENNDLTSHAEAPMLWLILEERDGRFKVNLSRTWEENRSKTTGESGEILQNAVLAKYCERKAELEKMIKVAKPLYDKEDFEKFMKIISQVVPGELPRRNVKVSKERVP
jgi:hypothetical protein